MRISVYPSDNNACGNYRLAWPGQVLADRGHDVVVNPYRVHPGIHHEVEIPIVRDVATRRVVEVGPVDADVVVLQRGATENMLRIMDGLRDQGIRVVMDVDDALWSIHRGNVAWRIYNDPRSDASGKWVKRCLGRADLITASTYELVKPFTNPRAVLPNMVPERALDAGEKVLEDRRGQWRPVHVGWAATAASHPTDPQVTKGQVARWVRDDLAGRRFLAVGGGGMELGLFGFRPGDRGLDGNRGSDADVAQTSDVAPANGTGPVPSTLWYDHVSMLDVSLVPLAPTKFNRSKSGLKMLESAAAGCAVLASDTPDNQRLARQGIGTTVRGNRWYDALEALVEGGGLWEQREHNWKVAHEHTIEEHAGDWLRAWMGA